MILKTSRELVTEIMTACNSILERKTQDIVTFEFLSSQTEQSYTIKF